MHLISAERPRLARSGARRPRAVAGTLCQPHRPAPAHQHQIMDEQEHELNITERSALGSEGRSLALLAWPAGAQACAGQNPSLLATRCNPQHGTAGLQVPRRLMLAGGGCVRNVPCADESCDSCGGAGYPGLSSHPSLGHRHHRGMGWHPTAAGCGRHGASTWDF